MARGVHYIRQVKRKWIKTVAILGSPEFERICKGYAKTHNMPIQKVRQFAVKKLSGWHRIGNSKIRSTTTKINEVVAHKRTREMSNTSAYVQWCDRNCQSLPKETKKFKTFAND